MFTNEGFQSLRVSIHDGKAIGADSGLYIGKSLRALRHGSERFANSIFEFYRTSRRHAEHGDFFVFMPAADVNAVGGMRVDDEAACFVDTPYHFETFLMRRGVTFEAQLFKGIRTCAIIRERDFALF